MIRRPRWTPAELDYLEQLAGEIPPQFLMGRMKAKARELGWPHRTEQAITEQVLRMGYTKRCRFGEWTTTGGAAEVLGCSTQRVHSWLKRKRIREILKPQRSGGQYYVWRTSWRRLAREMPRVFGGFGADALFLLLEDRELADAVAAAHPGPMADWRVRCVETGQVWPNCAAAARELHVTGSAITCAIRERRSVVALGMTFEALRGQGSSVSTTTPSSSASSSAAMASV